MPATNNFNADGKKNENPAQFPDEPLFVQPSREALDEISKTLKQMLLLAELSASDADVDRDSLQKLLDRLKDKIDHISDNMGKA